MALACANASLVSVERVHCKTAALPMSDVVFRQLFRLSAVPSIATEERTSIYVGEGPNPDLLQRPALARVAEDKGTSHARARNRREGGRTPNASFETHCDRQVATAMLLRMRSESGGFLAMRLATSLVLPSLRPDRQRGGRVSLVKALSTDWVPFATASPAARRRDRGRQPRCHDRAPSPFCEFTRQSDFEEQRESRRIATCTRPRLAHSSRLTLERSRPLSLRNTYVQGLPSLPPRVDGGTGCNPASPAKYFLVTSGISSLGL